MKPDHRSSKSPSPSAPEWSRQRWWMGGLGTGVIAAATIAGLLMFNPWSNGVEPSGKKDRDEFAQDRAPTATDAVPFDSKRALGYLEDICKIGPRISGTDGMAKQQELLTKHFEKLGGKVSLQKFTASQRSQKNDVEMANLIVSWRPDLERRVILCSHYDTRPIADRESDRRKWHDAFVSANDGGSGVAFLMELAHAMKDLKTNVGVDFVFFDGEEYVFDKDDEYFFGSKQFGKEYKKIKAKEKTRYLGAVLLDMIAGKNVRFDIEPDSFTKAGSLVEEIWSIAAEQKCTAFKTDFGMRVEDDHIALNRAGIKAIDLVDMNYKHWHRLTDVPENCSKEGLEQVAKVVGVWLQRAK